MLDGWPGPRTRIMACAENRCLLVLAERLTPYSVSLWSAHAHTGELGEEDVGEASHL